VGRKTGKADRRKSLAFGQKKIAHRFGALRQLSRGNGWLRVEGIPEPIPLTGGDCVLLARDNAL